MNSRTFNLLGHYKEIYLSTFTRKELTFNHDLPYLCAFWKFRIHLSYDHKPRLFVLNLQSNQSIWDKFQKISSDVPETLILQQDYCRYKWKLLERAKYIICFIFKRVAHTQVYVSSFTIQRPWSSNEWSIKHSISSTLHCKRYKHN